MYANGEGVPNDNGEVYKWWTLAAVQGHTHAKDNIEMLTKRMAKQELAMAQEWVAAWLNNFQAQ